MVDDTLCFSHTHCDRECLLLTSGSAHSYSLIASIIVFLYQESKGTKRKADGGSPTPGFPSAKVSGGPLPPGVTLPPGLSLTPSKDQVKSIATRRESGHTIKKPNKDLLDEPQHRVGPKGRLSESLKYCNEVLRELFGKKHSGYAWPFYKPVDAETLGLHDYHLIIKQPMDLGTIKRKMDSREYQAATEFETDVLLIFKNCYKYNPPEHDVVGMARRLEEVFRAKMARMPKDADDSMIPAMSGGSHSSGHSSQLGHSQVTGAGLARLQEGQDDSEPEGDTSDWNKRLMQVGITL